MTNTPTEVQEASSRPTVQVLRRGEWVDGQKTVLTRREQKAIDNPLDGRTVHKVLPCKQYKVDVLWAESMLTSSNLLPTISTLFAGFSITNLFESDAGAFNSRALLNIRVLPGHYHCSEHLHCRSRDYFLYA